MVDFNLFINKEITEIQRIDRKGLFTEHYSRGLCFGVDGGEKYLVIAVKRFKLICELLNYVEVSEKFPRFEINDIATDDLLAYFLGQKIISIRFHNDSIVSNKSYYLMITNHFKLEYDNSGCINLNNRND